MAARRAFLLPNQTKRVLLSTRNIHRSTPLSHHLPRDPNVPYNPRWKPNPLFPPGFFKKMFQDGRAKFGIDYLKHKKYCNKLGTAVAQLLGVWAMYEFKASREMDLEKEKLFNDIEESFEHGMEEFEAGVAVLEGKNGGRSEEEKKKVMEDILILSESLSVVQRLKVAQRITKDELLMIFFQQASNEEKSSIIKAICNGEIWYVS